MRQKTIGFIIVAIAVLIGLIIFLFNNALTSIVNTACSHGPECPMWGTIEFQTNVGIVIMIFVIGIGAYLIFSKDEGDSVNISQYVPKEINMESYGEVLKNSTEEERNVLEKVIGAKGAIFQADLVEQSGFSKVKVSRILDKLEGRGLIERKRRGMTNAVILKPAENASKGAKFDIRI